MQPTGVGGSRSAAGVDSKICCKCAVLTPADLADRYGIGETAEYVPPILRDSGDGAELVEARAPDLWARAGVSSGLELWERMTGSLPDQVRTRVRPAVDPEIWDELTRLETIRRYERIRTIHRVGERARGLDRVCSAQSVWHHLHEYAVVDGMQTGMGHTMPAILWPSQVALVLWYLEGLDAGTVTQPVHRVHLKSRAVGASWWWMHLAVWHWLHVPGWTCLAGSLKGEDADDRTYRSLLGKADLAYRAVPYWLRPPSAVVDTGTGEVLSFTRAEETRIEYHLRRDDTGAEIRAATMNDNFGRSGRHSAVFVDEAARLTDRLQESIGMALASVAQCTVWNSTPAGGNRYKRRFEAAAARGDDALVSYWTADPRRDDAWRAAQGDDDASSIEFDCSFAAVTGSRIWSVHRSVVCYDDDTPEWSDQRHYIAANLPKVCAIDVGKVTAAVTWAVDWEGAIESGDPRWPRYPLLWCLVAAQYDSGMGTIQPHDIAADLKRLHAGYTGRFVSRGDPAGESEVRGGSWFGDLRQSGWPVRGLPASPYHDHDFILSALRLYGRLIELGRIRIHAHRHRELLEAMEAWQWAIPAGRTPSEVSAETLRWRKDGPSHMCEAAWYGVLYALRSMQPDPPDLDDETDPLDGYTSMAHSLTGLYGGADRRR